MDEFQKLCNDDHDSWVLKLHCTMIKKSGQVKRTTWTTVEHLVSTAYDSCPGAIITECAMVLYIYWKTYQSNHICRSVPVKMAKWHIVYYNTSHIKQVLNEFTLTGVLRWEMIKQGVCISKQTHHALSLIYALWGKSNAAFWLVKMCHMWVHNQSEWYEEQ